MSLRPAYNLLAYYLTLALFGLFGFELTLVSLLAALLPRAERRERLFQRLIHRHFVVFHWWCERAGLVYVRYRGFERLPRGGAVLVSNHPALIDVTCLLARVPEALCIFKPAIRRNPVLGAAARSAGYLSGDGRHELIRTAAEKVAEGNLLLVFPEGTRTPAGVPLLPFKPGFVVIARRANAPIQLVRITTDSDVLTKGRAWWRLPRFPAHIQVEAGPLITVNPESETADAVARIEAWFRAEESADAANPLADAPL
jgi:1-acyl-sn-glycerol-3-phosphate acyltransferase